KSKNMMIIVLSLQDPEESLIVLSDCGTSGRIAYLLVTSFNEMLNAQKQKQICSYIIAGGDRALLTSQEAPEDDPALGARTLDKVCAGKKRVLFIGISCGMSAPFVAGQHDFCLKHLDVFTPVLLGFNAVHMARSEPMQDCSFHFKDVAERMTAEQRPKKALLLNPVLGAEAISGSSRMKGGSATKIILETILLAGHEAAFRGKITPDEMVYETTSSNSDELAALIHKNKAHVYYTGWQTLGIIGLTDAFTFTFSFINTGFSKMRNKEGDLSSLVSSTWICNMTPVCGFRMVGLIIYHHCQRFTGCSESECERALLRAIYSTDDLSEDMTSADVWKHTDAANRRDRVVPTALVKIRCGCTLAEARHHLDCHPVIRDAVSTCFSSSKNKSTVDQTHNNFIIEAEP
uniref:SIS domain-containing protein n=1 Tax=Sinocyclocheilus anshuiensis TaxID=1608454 RepID=A0A671SSH6_9TELE